MSDRKPVVIAMAVGGLALAANGAAAVIAISESSPPEVAVFGIVELTAAFIGLIATILWAWREEAAQPRRRRERVFTPWVALPEDHGLRRVAPRNASPLAMRVAPAAATSPTPASVSGRVIYLQEWLKAHSEQHANA